MPLITRQEKGTKLTIQDMDGNLTYLQSNGFVDGEYSQTVEGTGEIIGTFDTIQFIGGTIQFIGGTIQFSNPLDSGTVGTYTVSPTTDGSGTGAQFKLVVNIQKGAFAIDGSLSLVLNGGSGYAVGDTLTVDLMDLGGNMGETVVFTLLAGGVDDTKTSTITVTEDEINLSTTTISVTGSIASDSSITTVGNISGNNVIATNILQGSLLLGSGLTIFNPSNPTIVNFTNLPSTDPVKLGQLWNDSGSLKISAGV
jgi:hypothetical protein